MYATRETKSAAKAQKKTQKVTKKQQQKQQQQQQQQQHQNGIKIGNTTRSSPNAKTPQQTTNNNNNNNNSIVPNNNKDPPTETTNTGQKFRAHYEAERRATVAATTLPSLPGYENVAKMERSNSFSLRTKLSKFINHLTGSKENLSRTEEDAESGRTPFTFTRSRSMILMRRPNRRSFIEPQLEQLSEETEKSGGDLTSPASPRKTSMAEESPVLLRRGEVSDSVRTPTRRQSAHPITSTPLDEVSSAFASASASVPVVQRKASLMSDNPQLNFQKRRSNTLIASFKSTFSGLAGGGGGGSGGSGIGIGGNEKKDKMNPKWSASLQSLQAIDNMVSYANMSFIDYDKFNGYEKQLERQQSLMSLAEQPLPVATQLPLPATAMTHSSHSHSPSPSLPVPLVSSLEETVVRTVVMRRNKRGSSTSLAARTSLDTDYEHNLDKVHNVYRESLDSRTLELLNLRSRNSFIQDQPLLFDALNLEDGSVARRCKLCSQRVARSGSMKHHHQQQQQRDAVDGRGNPKKQLKSKSLTHLDGLDTVVACQHGPGGTAATTSVVQAPGVSSGHQHHHQAAATTPTALGRQPHATEKSDPARVCPLSVLAPQSVPHPPTIYTQAPQIVRRAPSLMLSLSPTLDITTTAASACFAGTGRPTVHSSASSLHHHQQQQHQHQQNQKHPQQPAMAATAGTAATSSCTSATSGTATTHSIPSSSSFKHFQYPGGEAQAAATSLSPYSSTPTSGPPLTSPSGLSATTSATVKKKSSFLQRKKPLLTRSEVSSSEFFSVSFCMDSSQHPDEEFIPATKGVTLLNALSHALRRRNLTFSQITITDNNPTPSFLDAGPSPATSSVDEQTDVENLAGHHLCITERGSNRKPLQKAASFGSRQPPPRLLPSASTEETSDAAVAAGKQIKQRWSSLFGIKNPQQSQLCELLNSYSRSGVPQRAEGLSFEHPDLDNSLAYLQNMHKSWRDFVESDAMPESEVKIQTAIWELVTTEVYYIHALQTVTDLFLACLEAVQEERLLIDVDQARLFSNVRAVCEANIKFWTMWLYPMVAHSVMTHEPLRCAFFQEGFIAFASIFAPYKIYCAEQSTCQFYCKELNQNNPLFTSYLAWCESQKMCNRLRLADIVVRPMQRLTKYSLLLAAIKKHMGDVEEIEAIDVMMHSVENFVGSVNNHLTMRQENERLKGVMVRIESYDVVDTNNEGLEKLIKQHSQMFDLCAPMRGCPAYHVRHLFMEGDHKFKDNLGKSDVHCFLLTDLLLVCKTMAKRGLGALKVIRQPYLTDQLIVHMAPNNTLNCVYLNEFQVATTAFTLQCTEAKNWYDAMWRAKTIYQRLKRGAGGGGGGGTVGDSFRFGGSGTSGGTADSLGVRKSPMNSSICSHVSSANNSHSGSVEWNDSRNISVDFEKTNSVSSDEGSGMMTGNHGMAGKGKQQLISGLHKAKIGMIGAIGSKSANTLTVQPLNHLGQSLPNLNMHHSHTNNTLLVPGTTTSHSGNMLLSPSHRGISYPPPSPTRVPLRRGMAFSTSTKNPPLRKTRNVTSQNSINWHQIPATPTPTPPSPRSQHTTTPASIALQKSLPVLDPSLPPLLHKQLSHQAPLTTSSTETDV
ncbi:uncharacterized protein LOC108151004 isoform X3 [Drosophila miranda]|uniref:uncharacterized protein LOC108151004 isoform X3 n=1 Tax=Drosophila miranda TaxID=7229 RepID=UPI00143F21D5|nr:uncharacterized protein LOC108151004 isoform X3 [Drosophila miranda]XP_033242487.1 uncharacterized protein LOC108151004 isoform X3 [Drosophila miranda]XP_033242488.1 uncharacterized protein LOC108151004 isoform X3 [Drosophila miranda]XP_033242489.1 uncharacterized protein LOC108151004 isoform X3 [Drosophila miranda]